VHRSWAEAEEALAGFRRESGKDRDLTLDIGRFYEANGRYAEAEKAFTSVLDEDSTKAQALTARSRLALLKLRSGKTQEAADLVSEILEEAPTDAIGLLTRAELALQRDDTSAAIVDLRTALGNEPDSVPVAAALARAHLLAGQPELAEQVLRGVVELKPQDVQARLTLAQFLVDRGRARDAAPVIEQLVLQQPGNVPALAALAQLQLAGRDPGAALRSASMIQALQPTAASGYLLAGQIQESQQQAEAARKTYELAAKMDPNSLEPLIALARLNVRNGQPESTLPLLEQRIELTPSNAMLYVLRGEVLLAMRQPQRAAESFAAAVDKQPTLLAAYRGLARSQMQAQRWDDAVTTLRQGMKATGEAPVLALELAAVLAQRGRTSDAIAVYERMLARDPAMDPAANDLALLLASQHNDPQSLKRAGDLVARFASASNPAFLDTRGWVLYQQGKYAEAVAALEKAVAAAPAVREIRYHLGMAQLKAGKPDEAKRNLEAAVGEGPAYDGIEVARTTLATL
jgi:tetratricopeptide (TPR) repeat protein